MMRPPHTGYGQPKKRLLWPYVVGAVIACAFVAMIIGPQIVVAWLVLSNHSKAQEQIAEKERAAKERREQSEGDTASPPRPTESKEDDPNEVSLEGMDPARASVSRMMTKGSEAMKRLSPEAKFESLNVRGAIAGETVDLTSGASFTMGYTLHAIDRSKAPGKDLKSARFAINADARACKHRQSPCLRIMRLDAPVPDPRPVPLPSCEYSAVWKAAVASGVPTNAVARVLYSRAVLDERGEWLLFVDGHDELTRHIDGTTCRVEK